MTRSPQAVSAERIIADARWFPVDLDRETGGILCADLGDKRPGWNWDCEEARAETSKLVADVVLAPDAAFRLISSQQSRPRINFIWHTAWCCSTAIAHALDVPGQCLSLQEPHVMNSVALARRECDVAKRGDISWVSDVVFRLMAHSTVKHGPVTVKPAPVANYLVGDALAKTRGKMLFLYSSCGHFLRAAIRHDEFRRRFVRGLFGFLAEEGGRGRWSPQAVARMTDLEVAGLVWVLQMEKFARDIKRCGERAASLDCALFLENPGEVLRALWRFFEMPGRVEDSSAFRDAGFFNRHLTYPDDTFTLALRRDAMDGLPPRLRQQIEEIAKSSIALLPEGTLPLPNPLMTVENYAA
jgi:hypothetical protein